VFELASPTSAEIIVGDDAHTLIAQVAGTSWFQPTKGRRTCGAMQVGAYAWIRLRDQRPENIVRTNAPPDPSDASEHAFKTANFAAFGRI
jgi:hypothetical protein